MQIMPFIVKIPVIIILTKKKLIKIILLFLIKVEIQIIHD